jgi:hypothetical protein
MAAVVGEGVVNDVTVEYEGMASAGTSRATETGRSSAKKHFNASRRLSANSNYYVRSNCVMRNCLENSPLTWPRML